MNHKINLQTIANEIKAAQDQCKPIEPLTSRFGNFSNDEAYAVAQLIHEMRIKEGAKPVGRKIGFTNPEMWKNIRSVRADLGLHLRYHCGTTDRVKSPMSHRTFRRTKD